MKSLIVVLLIFFSSSVQARRLTSKQIIKELALCEARFSKAIHNSPIPRSVEGFCSCFVDYKRLTSHKVPNKIIHKCMDYATGGKPTLNHQSPVWLYSKKKIGINTGVFMTQFSYCFKMLSRHGTIKSSVYTCACFLDKIIQTRKTNLTEAYKRIHNVRKCYRFLKIKRRKRLTDKIFI